MKQLLVLLVGCCLLPVGCTSTSNMPSRFTSSLFGKKSSDHTLAQDDAESGKATSDKTSLASNSSSPFNAGEAALKAGNFREAKKQFQKVVQQDPNNATAHHRLAYLADMDKDYSIAEIHYLAALRIEPKNADIACDLGYSYLLQERSDDSRRYLEKALRFDPNHHYAKMNLATLHSQQGDYAAAMAMLRQAVSEEEAQAHIAQLFPDGPPEGMQVANNTPEISPATRELQQKLAQRSGSAPNQHPSGQSPAPQQRHQPGARPPLDLANMDPREIPPEMINDVFAQIDQEYDRSRLNAPPVSPANGLVAQSDQAIHTQVKHEEPRGPAGAEPFPTSIPGDLPTNSKADPYSDYVVLGPPPGGNSGQNANQPGAGLESPYFQPEDMTRLQQQPTPPFNAQPNSPITPAGGMAAGSGNSSGLPGLERPAAGSMPDPSKRPAGTHPFAHLPEAGQSAPTQGVGTSNLSYQEAMAKALQMGMNAGPGQMFPSDFSQPSVHSSNRPAEPSNSIYGSRALPPSNTPMPPLGQMPTMPELPADMQRPTVKTEPMPSARLQTSPETSTLNLPASNPPTGGMSPTPQPNMSSNSGQIQQTSAQNTGVESETPWFTNSDDVQTTQSNRHPLPERSPQPSYHTPQQWPHSPQAQSGQPTAGQPAGSQPTNSNYAPMIHRGVQPPAESNAVESNAAESNAAPLPQVVPGVR